MKRSTFENRSQALSFLFWLLLFCFGEFVGAEPHQVGVRRQVYESLIGVHVKDRRDDLVPGRPGNHHAIKEYDWVWQQGKAFDSLPCKGKSACVPVSTSIAINSFLSQENIVPMVIDLSKKMRGSKNRGVFFEEFEVGVSEYMEKLGYQTYAVNFATRHFANGNKNQMRLIAAISEANEDYRKRNVDYGGAQFLFLSLVRPDGSKHLVLVRGYNKVERDFDYDEFRIEVIDPAAHSRTSQEITYNTKSLRFVYEGTQVVLDESWLLKLRTMP